MTRCVQLSVLDNISEGRLRSIIWSSPVYALTWPPVPSAETTKGPYYGHFEPAQIQSFLCTNRAVHTPLHFHYGLDRLYAQAEGLKSKIVC